MFDLADDKSTRIVKDTPIDRLEIAGVHLRYADDELVPLPSPSHGLTHRLLAGDDER